MKFTENMLKSYEAPLSDTEEQKCKNAIKMVRDALSGYGYSEGTDYIKKAYEDTYAYSVSMSNIINGRKIKLFLQGSYANNTNVRAESDIDIAVILESTFAIKYAQGVTDSTYKFINSSDNIVTFKDDVEKVLIKKFGSDVERKNKSIKINGNGYRVDADSVPCLRYRDYSTDYLRNGSYIGGIKITADDGEIILNYPEQHIKNGREKNINTNGYYKKMVRVLKKIKGVMSEYGYEEADKMSSFGLESLLWNIPNEVYLKNSMYRHVYLFNKLIDYLMDNSNEIIEYKEANGIKSLCSNQEDNESIVSFIIKLKEFYQYE